MGAQETLGGQEAPSDNPLNLDFTNKGTTELMSDKERTRRMTASFNKMEKFPNKVKSVDRTIAKGAAKIIKLHKKLRPLREDADKKETALGKTEQGSDEEARLQKEIKDLNAKIKPLEKQLAAADTKYDENLKKVFVSLKGNIKAGGDANETLLNTAIKKLKAGRVGVGVRSLTKEVQNVFKNGKKKDGGIGDLDTLSNDLWDGKIDMAAFEKRVNSLDKAYSNANSEAVKAANV